MLQCKFIEILTFTLYLRIRPSLAPLYKPLDWSISAPIFALNIIENLISIHIKLGASTLSLESVDSNPRQAMARSDRQLGAVPRRPLGTTENPPSPTHPLLGSPTRALTDLPPGVRPPPYHPLSTLSPGHPPPPPGGPISSHPPGGTTHPHPPGGPAFPPMIPLPGLTCQLSVPPSHVSLPHVAAEERGHARSVREQQA